ncbi:MAG: response regulator transcription factor [Solirubrobacterales bacterium]
MPVPRLNGSGGGTAEAAPIAVFLVDDLPELRELIRLGMEEDSEFEVVGEAADGRSALEGIAETRPAAVLLDLSMPDMDGFSVIPEIRLDNPDTAIIILSGFAMERMGAKAIERGADAYIEKGTPIQEIRETVRAAVEARRRD